jgi:bifunctional non-homologous end joining protein LigD
MPRAKPKAAARTKRRRPGALATYYAKRHFKDTPEPRGHVARSAHNIYMIQKHAATRLHFDFRLELDGVLKSWAVTKGPSLDPTVKRLAVRTEDHPIEYATFEGRIPKGNYGAGTVLLWDRGSWEPIGDPHEGLAKGKIAFNLRGQRLHGRWALVRMRNKEGEKRENWLLIKERDQEADPERDIVAEETTSVASGRALEDIATAPEAIWTGKPGDPAPKATRVKRAKLPAFVEPMMATLVDDVPDGRDWVFEMKFDGYRALAAASGDNVRIYTRNGQDWTAKFPSIARAVGRLELDGTLLDGEIVAIDEKGRSDFGTLQGALQGNDAALSYFVFDLLEEGGHSLRRKPLTERKERLRTLLGDAGRKGPVFFVDHVESNGAAMLKSLCDKGFEGVLAKRADSLYTPGRRTKSWMKIKCGNEQEFVIVGWSKSDKKDRPFASIVLAVHEGGKLRYAGRVGSGFSQRTLAMLAKRFKPVAKPPVADKLPRAITRDVQWVEPDLVAQVEFAEFTSDGIIRQGRFLGLREDKPARKITREKARPVEEVE